jgi:hypothetical protein
LAHGGAGNSLEGLRRWALDHGVPALAEALAADTPEPNLRHQRLLGGALVLGRGLSPLGALCLAADARLVTVEARAGLPISGWQGPGLITGLELPAAPLAFAGLGLLPASRPIVFAAAARLESGTRIVVGSAGGCLTPGEWPEGAVRPLANHATDLAAALRDDPQGSAAWKTRCLAALLQDLEDRLWT